MDWINVHTELPEPGKEVLVAVAGIGDYYPIYDIGYREPGGDHKWMLYGGTVSEITHWMPLPKAPPLPCWINGKTCCVRKLMELNEIGWPWIAPPANLGGVQEEANKCEGCVTYALRESGSEVPAGYWDERK